MKQLGQMFVVLTIVASLLLAGCAKTYTTEETNAMVKSATQDVAAQYQTKLDDAAKTANDKITALNAETSELKTQISSIKTSLDTVKAEKDALQKELDAKPVEVVPTEPTENEGPGTATESNMYVEDELSLGGLYDFAANDNKLSKLFDGEIEFDDDTYDAEEKILLNDIEIAINGENFNELPYMVLKEDGLEYVYTVETKLDTSLISEDEPLEIVFLGKPMKIVEWSANSLTFDDGVKEYFKEGETKTILGKDVTVVVIANNKVMVKIGDETKVIAEEETEDFGDLEVKADTILNDDGESDFCKLVFAEDISNTIETGDEYAEDSPFVWKVTTKTISVVLNDDFDELDEDNEFNAIGKDGVLSLPEGYATLKFLGLESVATKEYSLELDTKNGNDYVKIKGEFLKDLEDYTLLYVDATGFYDSDLELVATNFVELENSDVTIVLSGTKLKLGTVELALNFNTLTADGTDLTNYDDNFVTSYGIVVKTPEDNYDNEKVKLVVPEEQVTAAIALY